MTELNQIKINLFMKVAALKQYLRDRSDEMAESEQDEVLDQLNKYLDAIDAIEQFEKQSE
jgi:hypothetical protein